MYFEGLRRNQYFGFTQVLARRSTVVSVELGSLCTIWYCMTELTVAAVWGHSPLSPPGSVVTAQTENLVRVINKTEAELHLGGLKLFILPSAILDGSCIEVQVELNSPLSWIPPSGDTAIHLRRTLFRPFTFRSGKCLAREGG